VKICGITNIEDALAAASLGVDAVGFVFAPSLRRVEPSTAREIIRRLPGLLVKVGVFVNQDFSEVEAIAAECDLSALQFHGDESPEYCERFSLPTLKAIRIKNLDSLKEMERFPRSHLLLDTFSSTQAGGTGVSFPWEIARTAKEGRDFILSGGLNPGNVREAIQYVRPFGVDVSSGVESMPGKKERVNMMEFLKQVQKAEDDIPMGS
jgi:phosphoribosylanthranilate isomerase